MSKLKNSENHNKIVSSELSVESPSTKKKKSRFKFLKRIFSKHNNNEVISDINFEWTRRATKKIIKQLVAKNIDYFYFYTAIDNIFYILDHGIEPINMKKLKEHQKYIVWNYLEKAEYIELDLSNTSRNEFWNWCLENDINLSTVAVFYVDLKKLYEATKKDWEIDDYSQRIIIRESIKISAILGILVKDFEIYQRLKQYLDTQKIAIKLFYGENGSIKFGKELNNEKA